MPIKEIVVDSTVMSTYLKKEFTELKHLHKEIAGFTELDERMQNKINHWIDVLNLSDSVTIDGNVRKVLIEIKYIKHKELMPFLMKKKRKGLYLRITLSIMITYFVLQMSWHTSEPIWYVGSFPFIVILVISLLELGETSKKLKALRA